MFAQRKKLWIIAAAVLAVGVIGGGTGVGIAVAKGGGDDDQPITGSALAECTAAALAGHPGGTVTETEVGDDGAAYGVEIRLDDGSEVEVNLDENCEVIGQEPDDGGDDDDENEPDDDDGPDDQDGSDDDDDNNDDDD